MHIASLVKIPCYLLKLSSGNENMGVSQADNSVKIWRNLPISNPKPDLHNFNAHNKWWKSIDVYSSYHPEMKNGWTDVQRADRHTDVQRETIIPATIVWRGIIINITAEEENRFWLSILCVKIKKCAKMINI